MLRKANKVFWTFSIFKLNEWQKNLHNHRNQQRPDVSHLSIFFLKSEILIDLDKSPRERRWVNSRTDQYDRQWRGITEIPGGDEWCLPFFLLSIQGFYPIVMTLTEHCDQTRLSTSGIKSRDYEDRTWRPDQSSMTPSRQGQDRFLSKCCLLKFWK